MELIIKSMHLEMFKGCKDRVVTFADGMNKVKGANGLGKTTLQTAYLWTLYNVDGEGNSNPNVFPIGVEECVPRVTIDFVCDGRPLEVSKMVKRTVKSTGAMTFTSTYTVNAVEYGLDAFKNKLTTDYGFDFDKMLALSNSLSFVNKKKEEQRNILLAMADNSKSDRELALELNCIELAQKLANYDMNEIESMAKASNRKIVEVYGKHGEILNAQIEGLEMAKVKVDIATEEKRLNELHSALYANIKEQDTLNNAMENADKLNSDYMKAKFELGDYERNQESATAKINAENVKELNNLQSDLRFIELKIDSANDSIGIIEEKINVHENCRKGLAEDYKKVMAEVLSSDSEVCPTCGQTYPAEKIETIKSDFEKSKASRLEKITEDGKREQVKIKDLQTQLSNKHDEIAKLIVRKTELLNDIETMQNAPEVVTRDYSKDPEYLALSDKVKNLETMIKRADAIKINEKRMTLRETEKELNSKIAECNKVIASFENNEKITHQIEELREKQSDYEQALTDNDKTLDQLATLKMAKNKLLADSINAHFDIVTFHLFETQKNGETKDACYFTIDGFRNGESTNTGREVLGCIDIVKGLQRFYGVSLPVFVDGMECLSSDTLARLNVSNQLIGLYVTEDKELVIN